VLRLLRERLEHLEGRRLVDGRLCLLRPLALLEGLRELLHLGEREAEPPPIAHQRHQLGGLPAARPLEGRLCALDPAVALSDARLEYAQLVERQIELLLAARVQPLHLLQRLDADARCRAQRRADLRLPRRRLAQPRAHQLRLLGAQVQLRRLAHQRLCLRLGQLGRGLAARGRAPEQVRVHARHPALARGDARAERRHLGCLQPEHLRLALQLLQLAKLLRLHQARLGGPEPRLGLLEPRSQRARLREPERRIRGVRLAQRGAHLRERLLRGQDRAVPPVPPLGGAVLGGEKLQAGERRLERRRGGVAARDAKERRVDA